MCIIIGYAMRCPSTVQLSAACSPSQSQQAACIVAGLHQAVHVVTSLHQAQMREQSGTAGKSAAAMEGHGQAVQGAHHSEVS